MRTRAYEAIGKIGNQVQVNGLEYLVEHANAQDSILLVDDVFDTGLTMKAVIEEYHARARKNAAFDIRIATVYYKPDNNRTSRKPDFFLRETNQWLVFPHELHDLTAEEIREGKGEEVYKLLYGSR